jgi:cell division protein ZapA (FtsZ GTPase activity inhibitor)
VDKKMRAAADVVQTGDSVRLAVLAALNIADEYFRCRNAEQVRQSELNERAARVEQLLDQALDQLGTPAGSGS